MNNNIVKPIGSLESIRFDQLLDSGLYKIFGDKRSIAKSHLISKFNPSIAPITENLYLIKYRMFRSKEKNISHPDPLNYEFTGKLGCVGFCIAQLDGMKFTLVKDFKLIEYTVYNHQSYLSKNSRRIYSTKNLDWFEDARIVFHIKEIINNTTHYYFHVTSDDNANHWTKMNQVYSRIILVTQSDFSSAKIFIDRYLRGQPIVRDAHAMQMKYSDYKEAYSNENNDSDTEETNSVETDSVETDSAGINSDWESNYSESNYSGSESEDSEHEDTDIIKVYAIGKTIWKTKKFTSGNFSMIPSTDNGNPLYSYSFMPHVIIHPTKFEVKDNPNIHPRFKFFADDTSIKHNFSLGTPAIKWNSTGQDGFLAVGHCKFLKNSSDDHHYPIWQSTHFDTFKTIVTGSDTSKNISFYLMFFYFFDSKFEVTKVSHAFIIQTDPNSISTLQFPCGLVPYVNKSTNGVIISYGESDMRSYLSFMSDLDIQSMLHPIENIMADPSQYMLMILRGNN
jgi:hypothetical protein